MLCSAIIAGGLWIFLYTFSYGVWEWKQKNKHGAVFVFLLSILTAVLWLICGVIY